MTRRYTGELRDAAEPIWAAQKKHPFVLGMADGTLPPVRFAHFLEQDCLFIPQYSRALALAAARGPDIEVSAVLFETASSLLNTELGLNRELAIQFGIEDAELDQARATPTTRAYTDFLLRIAALHDFAEVAAGFLPCFWGYYDVFSELANRPRSPNRHYARWIEAYSSESIAAKVNWFRSVCDRAAEGAGAETRERMRRAFIVSSELELAFWEMAWSQERPGLA